MRNPRGAFAFARKLVQIPVPVLVQNNEPAVQRPLPLHALGPPPEVEAAWRVIWRALFGRVEPVEPKGAWERIELMRRQIW